MPEPKVEVTEHRIESKKCPCCGEISKEVFPENVTAHTQYGERIQTLSAYFFHQHLLPFERLSQIFNDIFGVEISPEICANIDRRLCAKLKTFEKNLKKHFVNSQVLHLRKLTFVYEHEKEAWAKDMKEFLLTGKRQNRPSIPIRLPLIK